MALSLGTAAERERERKTGERERDGRKKLDRSASTRQEGRKEGRKRARGN